MPGTGLDAIADPDGRFAVLAMDQRVSLDKMLTRAGLPSQEADYRAFKVDVVGALSPLSTGALLDPDYGVPAVHEADVLAAGCGVLVAAEPAVKQLTGGEYRTVLVPGRDAAWVRAMGGDALKFLVYWDPFRTASAGDLDLADEAISVIGALVADCRAQGVPSVVEPLVTFAPGASPSPLERFASVIRSAERLAALGPDLLKLEWPGDAAGCRTVTTALGAVPWTLLSAGVRYPEFVERTRIALDAGASGFIAGRAIWGEATTLVGQARRTFLAEVAAPRLAGLLDVLDGRGRSWREVAA